MEEEEAKQGRILVVDDDATMRLLAQAALENAGFAVETLGSGDTAVATMARLRPDLVLLDVDMPGMDGFACCEAIRATPAGRDLPIIMMTGLDDVPSIHRAYELGATDFTPKPVQWIILGQRIRYILRASASFLQLQESRERLLESQRVARLGTWRIAAEGAGPGEMEASEELLTIFQIGEESRGQLLEAFIERVHPEDRAAVQAAAGGSFLTAEPFDLQHRIQRPDGSTAVIRVQGSPRPHPSGVGLVLHGVSQDVTDRHRAESQIRYLETHDRVTGLGNRTLLGERLRRALTGCRRGQHVALICLDLRDISRLDDLHGHGTADAALCGASAQLEEGLRRFGATADQGDLSRVGDTQLMLLLSDLDSTHEAAVSAGHALETLQISLDSRNGEVTLTPRAGIAIGPGDGRDAETLIRCAQTAVDQALDGRATEPVFYDREVHERALEHVALEGRLREAIGNGRIRAFFQPKFRVADRRLCGAEALARWSEPNGAPATPDVFIAIAEEAGMIGSIGETMLRQACERWRDWLPRIGGGRVAVNLSPLQLADPRLAAWVSDILVTTGLSPTSLELEVTESALLESESTAIAALEDLRHHGIRIALDDFGTGYSSLSHLRKLPVDTVKIDRSFVMALEEDGDGAAVVSAIVSLSHALRLNVVAEGVETEGQIRSLAAMGCDEIQGYLLGRPCGPDEFERSLQSGGLP